MLTTTHAFSGFTVEDIEVALAFTATCSASMPA